MSIAGDWDEALGAADAAVARLRALGWTVAACESLTGGLVVGALTSVPGASRVVRGGLVTYATDLKVSLARVSAKTVATAGVVSERTALAMAEGVRDRCGATVGLATTGVAGPGSADGLPAGTVWIAVVTEERRHAELLELGGGREQIRCATVTTLLRRLTEVAARSCE